MIYFIQSPKIIVSDHDQTKQKSDSVFYTVESRIENQNTVGYEYVHAVQ